MTRAEALAEARRRWGTSFGHVDRVTVDKHFSFARRLYRVGEWEAPSGRGRRAVFAVRGASTEGWAEAFANVGGVNTSDDRPK